MMKCGMVISYFTVIRVNKQTGNMVKLNGLISGNLQRVRENTNLAIKNGSSFLVDNYNISFRGKSKEVVNCFN